MKNDKDRLLEDVLLDEEFRAADEESYRGATAALHRVRRVRRVVAFTQRCALALLVSGPLVWLCSGIWKHEHPKQPTVAAVPNNSHQLPLLSDDELLSAFPPGTCALIEIDGKKVLVFRGAEERKKYFVN
jgi:hypothetical protein